MEASRRQRGVHWEDECVVYEPQQQRTHSSGNGQVAFPSPGASSMQRPTRDGSLSAAATLSLYLSDALGESGGRSPLRRRQVHSKIIEQRAAHGRPSIEDSSDLHAAADAPARPSSPLSRFLQRRFQQDGRPVRRLRDTSTSTSSMASQPNNPLRSRTLRSSGFTAGYMERLLREKITDAKRICEQLPTNRPCTTGLENQSPNQIRDALSLNTTGVPAEKSVPMESPRRSAEVPVPHPKPQRPQLPVKPLTSVLAAECRPKASEVSPRKCHTKNQSEYVETAARSIQRSWRQFLHRRYQQVDVSSVETEDETRKSVENELFVPPGTVQVVSIISASIENESVAADSDASANAVVTADDGGGLGDVTVENKAVSEAAIQTDSVASSESDQLTDEDRCCVAATDHSGKTVMWQDDEWSFLEEGRYATTELLDSSAHNEDTSMEALVRKRPHVAVGLQEARRLEQERARRAAVQKKKKKNGIQGEETEEPLPPEPTDTIMKTKKPVRIKLRQRKRPQLRLVGASTGLRSRQDETKSPEDETEGLLLADDHEPSHDGRNIPTDSDPEPIDRPDDSVYAAMLAQLHRYVEFDDMPLTIDGDNDASAITMRNDLISVADFLPLSSWADHETNSGCEETLGGGASVLSEEDTREKEKALDDIRSTEERDSALVQSKATSTESYLHSTAPPRLFPVLQQVESEVQRTLVRIQSQFVSSPSSMAPPAAPLVIAHTTAPPLEMTTKQREFREALDAFQQSLRASRASSRSSHSELLSTAELHLHTTTTTITSDDENDNGDDDDDDDGAVDAELEAMLGEIRRCKQQIASARRQ